MVDVRFADELIDVLRAGEESRLPVHERGEPMSSSAVERRSEDDPSHALLLKNSMSKLSAWSIGMEIFSKNSSPPTR